MIKLPPDAFDKLTVQEALSLAFKNDELTKFAKEMGPNDTSTFERTSETEAVLDLKMLQTARLRDKALKEEKKARKAAREKRKDAA